jgi:hypothetical protein
MNRFAACGVKDRKMTKDEMIGWFKSAPEGSRHQRMLWAAHKIACLTGATAGGAYQMLLVALIEAERLPGGSIPGFSMTADEYLDVLHAMTNAQIAAPLRSSKK